jgi:hypothetical protein
VTKFPSDGVVSIKLSILDNEMTRPIQQMGDSLIEDEEDESDSDDCKREYLPPSELTDLSDVKGNEGRSRLANQGVVKP